MWLRGITYKGYAQFSIFIRLPDELDSEQMDHNMNHNSVSPIKPAPPITCDKLNLDRI